MKSLVFLVLILFSLYGALAMEVVTPGVCTPNYSCDEWGPCLPGSVSFRECYDVHQCLDKQMLESGVVIVNIVSPITKEACNFFPHCTDNIKNNDESGVDCGGSCLGCPEGSMCFIDEDCENNRCWGGRCYVPSICEGASCHTGMVTGPSFVSSISYLLPFFLFGVIFMIIILAVYVGYTYYGQHNVSSLQKRLQRYILDKRKEGLSQREIIAQLVSFGWGKQIACAYVSREFSKKKE